LFVRVDSCALDATAREITKMTPGKKTDLSNRHISNPVNSAISSDEQVEIIALHAE
jgi:hypothetical protein